MKVIPHKQDKTKVLILALTQEDAEALNLFYEYKIIFGLWKIWLRTPDGKGENEPEIKAMLTQLPTLQGVGWLNLTRGFVPNEEVKVL